MDVDGVAGAVVVVRCDLLHPTLMVVRARRKRGNRDMQPGTPATHLPLRRDSIFFSRALRPASGPLKTDGGVAHEPVRVAPGWTAGPVGKDLPCLDAGQSYIWRRQHDRDGAPCSRHVMQTRSVDGQSSVLAHQANHLASGRRQQDTTLGHLLGW